MLKNIFLVRARASQPNKGRAYNSRLMSRSKPGKCRFELRGS